VFERLTLIKELALHSLEVSILTNSLLTLQVLLLLHWLLHLTVTLMRHGLRRRRVLTRLLGMPLHAATTIV
jgi:hypothetical protein